MLFDSDIFSDLNSQQDESGTGLNLKRSSETTESQLEAKRKKTPTDSGDSLDLREELSEDQANEEVIIIQLEDDSELNNLVNNDDIEIYECNDDSAISTDNDTAVVDCPVESTSAEYKCQHCNYITSKKSKYKRHTSEHEKRDSQETNKQDKHTGLNKHQSEKEKVIPQSQSNSKKVYKCNICEFQTQLLKEIREHCYIHKVKKNAKVRKCRMCDYRTTVKRDLEEHEKLIHYLNRRLLRCDICDFITINDREYDGHICHDTMFSSFY